ncbi:hypothetical protein [Streptosporangium roseum]|uniref:hypothetical protein n=1 Tax=Streptosporangium roseum TaxID=2001 RepID=UPI003333B8FB
MVREADAAHDAVDRVDAAAGGDLEDLQDAAPVVVVAALASDREMAAVRAERVAVQLAVVHVGVAQQRARAAEPGGSRGDARR